MPVVVLAVSLPVGEEIRSVAIEAIAVAEAIDASI